MEHPLTLVGGPAGAGKTLLVADWITVSPCSWPVVWLTVEAEDNAPGIFWAYVLGAFRHHGPALPADIGSPARPGEVDHGVLARLAAHLSGRSEPVVLVLDEFERVGTPEIAEGLEFVLRHAGNGLRLVMISRTEPLVPLHRYRAAGQITDIRGADLAFRPQEAAVLVDRHGMSLAAEGVQALTDRTGGWAAGLRLCVLAAQQAEDPQAFLKEFEAGQSMVADFLLTEVLAYQTAEVQDLLLRSSVLGQIHPDLANALTGRDDAAPILAQLERANAFMRPIGHSWYRLHPLFAEILRVHLRARHPRLEPELHRSAARWLSDAGLLTEALRHAADAGDWQFAASQLVDHLAIGRLFTGLETDRLIELFAAMAPDTTGPAADLIRAAQALGEYDAERGLRHLRRAEENLDRAKDPSPAARLSCAVLRVLASRVIGCVDMAEAAAKDAQDVEQEFPAACLDEHPELRALLLTGLGSAQLWAGRFEAARSALTAAVQAPGGAATALPRHESLSRLALIDFLDGRPSRAEAHARAAVAEAERSGLLPASRTGMGELVLAAVAIDRDDLGAARRHLDQAAVSSAALPDPIVTAELGILRSRMLLAKGRPGAALNALDAALRPPHAAQSPWVNDRVALAASNALLAQGRPREAVEALAHRETDRPDQAVASARARLAAGDTERAVKILDTLAGGNHHRDAPALAVRVLLVQAQAADTLDDAAAARQRVTRALATARPESLRRPFLEAGPWLRRLLHAEPALTLTHDWLPDELLPERSTAERGEPVPSPVVEHLSDREQEVLGRLAQMMSTNEIADDLHLSVNTVKTHLKSVYRKLATTRRRDAVRRARELRLL
ncbi:LuxR C-terminal-related transcriptional regulator [Streptomyces sp. V1I6]|uniref:LuxR C-terminal-related transcriptional regulator n=1 Tax=Streptomyces sp. V1I6 TaxID=3042273 RepID=UPI002786749C|nr:LuxR C-terminal-related transcriptional regulator [Streptomyces sp. V1I6]MDQ0841104.1 LuxR family maltose regulon positive regulatory protein [Streptomyces sp. V1I6]